MPTPPPSPNRFRLLRINTPAASKPSSSAPPTPTPTPTPTCAPGVNPAAGALALGSALGSDVAPPSGSDVLRESGSEVVGVPEAAAERGSNVKSPLSNLEPAEMSWKWKMEPCAGLPLLRVTVAEVAEVAFSGGLVSAVRGEVVGGKGRGGDRDAVDGREVKPRTQIAVQPKVAPPVLLVAQQVEVELLVRRGPVDDQHAAVHEGRHGAMGARVLEQVVRGERTAQPRRRQEQEDMWYEVVHGATRATSDRAWLQGRTMEEENEMAWMEGVEVVARPNVPWRAAEPGGRSCAMRECGGHKARRMGGGWVVRFRMAMGASNGGSNGKGWRKLFWAHPGRRERMGGRRSQRSRGSCSSVPSNAPLGGQFWARSMQGLPHCFRLSPMRPCLCQSVPSLLTGYIDC